MEISMIDPNTKLDVVYYNGRKSLHMFLTRTDVNLFRLKHQLDRINR